jgi:hypothetical protein
VRSMVFGIDEQWRNSCFWVRARLVGLKGCFGNCAATVAIVEKINPVGGVRRSWVVWVGDFWSPSMVLAFDAINGKGLFLG